MSTLKGPFPPLLQSEMHLVYHSTSQYIIVYQSISEYIRVYYSISQSISLYHSTLQYINIPQYITVHQSISEYIKISQYITVYQVYQCTTVHYCTFSPVAAQDAVYHSLSQDAVYQRPTPHETGSIALNCRAF